MPRAPSAGENLPRAPSAVLKPRLDRHLLVKTSPEPHLLFKTSPERPLLLKTNLRINFRVNCDAFRKSQKWSRNLNASNYRPSLVIYTEHARLCACVRVLRSCLNRKKGYKKCVRLKVSVYFGRLVSLVMMQCVCFVVWSEAFARLKRISPHPDW